MDREEIGWHVTACYPLKLESYTWWFPIAGTVPYKGYFDLDKTKEEEKELQKKDWILESESRRGIPLWAGLKILFFLLSLRTQNLMKSPHLYFTKWRTPPFIFREILSLTRVMRVL